MLQLCYIYGSYILLRLCVGMPALAFFSLQVIRILSTHLQVPEKSYAWLVYWFSSLCLHFMMWHYFTWLDNPVWQCTCNKTVMSQHPGLHFLIISSVLCRDVNDSYEQSIEERLVASVWMHKDSTGWTMNQVMTPFQQRFEKPCLYTATLSVWEKVCLCRGNWRILLGAVNRYPERWPVLWLPLSLNDHHTSPCGNNQQNLEYYIWPCLTTTGTWWWIHFGQCL